MLQLENRARQHFVNHFGEIRLKVQCPLHHDTKFLAILRNRHTSISLFPIFFDPIAP